MPLIAAASDRLGRQVCVAGSVVCFTVGSVLGCLARGIAVLLVGRCLQGVGGAGIIVLSLIIFTDIVPLRFRPKWYGTV
jgi:MFS family permease